MQHKMTATPNNWAVRINDTKVSKEYNPDTPEQLIQDAAESVAATYFREADEQRFMRTGGRRHYRVKGVDSRVAIAGSLAFAFAMDTDKRPEEVWWAIANHYFDLTALERGSVALLKRKNELLEVVRAIHALMPDIEEAATSLFNSCTQGGEA